MSTAESVAVIYPGKVRLGDPGVLTLEEVARRWPGALEMFDAQYPDKTEARFLDVGWGNPILAAAQGPWAVKWKDICWVERTQHISQYGRYKKKGHRASKNGGRKARIGLRRDDRGEVRAYLELEGPPAPGETMPIVVVRIAPQKPLTDAEIQAEVDAAMLAAGIITPDEIRRSRFGVYQIDYTL